MAARVPGLSGPLEKPAGSLPGLPSIRLDVLLARTLAIACALLAAGGYLAMRWHPRSLASAPLGQLLLMAPAAVAVLTAAFLLVRGLTALLPRIGLASYWLMLSSWKPHRQALLFRGFGWLAGLALALRFGQFVQGALQSVAADTPLESAVPVASTAAGLIVGVLVGAAFDRFPRVLASARLSGRTDGTAASDVLSAGSKSMIAIAVLTTGNWLLQVLESGQSVIELSVGTDLILSIIVLAFVLVASHAAARLALARAVRRLTLGADLPTPKGLWVVLLDLAQHPPG